MSLMEIATRAGVPLADLEELVRGTALNSVAEQLGVPLLALQEFIHHGDASSNMAHRLGISMAAAGELAQLLGPEGKIGLVVGLLIGAGGFERKNATSAG